MSVDGELAHQNPRYISVPPLAIRYPKAVYSCIFPHSHSLMRPPFRLLFRCILLTWSFMLSMRLKTRPHSSPSKPRHSHLILSVLLGWRNRCPCKPLTADSLLPAENRVLLAKIAAPSKVGAGGAAWVCALPFLRARRL